MFQKETKCDKKVLKLLSYYDIIIVQKEKEKQI